MRSNDTESSTATYIVIGLLIAATIIPLANFGTSLNKREFMNEKNSIGSDYQSQVIFISGGTKSGKSEFAEHLAKEVKQLSYVALSENNIDDKEWQEKIHLHRKRGQKLGNIETTDLLKL